MIGKITSWNGSKSCGFITGKDGNQYFLHHSEMIGRGAKKLHKNNIIRFDAVNNGEAHLRAVNARKIGHGTHHPFIKDLDRIEEMIVTCVDNHHPEKQYRLRDIQMLKNYFSEVCDIDWCPNVRERFRTHLSEEE